MATIEQIRALMEEAAKSIEDNLGSRIAALEEKLGPKEPIHEEEPNNDKEEEPPQNGANNALTKKLLEKIDMLEKSITAMRTHKDVVDIDSLSLFPKARLPPKFHMPNMDKFDGTTCPKTHLKMYVGALSPQGLSNELLAQLFQQSLTGAALRWFMKRDQTKIKTWEDICNAFHNQYHYNIEIDITRRELEITKQRNGEPFSSFLMRWRNKAAQMINRPSEQEQVDIIIQNLQPEYKNLLQFQYLPTFQSLIATATKIEDLLQNGQFKEESSEYENDPEEESSEYENDPEEESSKHEDQSEAEDQVEEESSENEFEDHTIDFWNSNYHPMNHFHVGDITRSE